MMKIYFVSRDEYGWGKQMELAELAELLRPLLQPAPADTAGFAQWVANGMAQHTAARLLAADKRREVAERQLAEAQQEIAALREDKFKHAAMLGAVMRQRDEYRAQADAARQAATVAAQRADAAEAKWAAIPWEDITCWVYSDSEAGKWLNANRPAAQD